MTFSQLIDQILHSGDNVSLSASDYGDRRTRISEYAIWTINDFTFRRHWKFRRKKSSLLTLSAGSVSVPTDFIALGPYGGLYSGATGDRLRETDEQEVQDIRQANGDNQWVFSIFSQDGTTGLQLIQVPTPAALTLYAWYERGVPTLDESTNVDKLKIAVPEPYHQTVLIPGILAKTQRSKGDSRTVEYLQAYEDGIKNAIRDEKRQQSGTRRAPGFWAR